MLLGLTLLFLLRALLLLGLLLLLSLLLALLLLGLSGLLSIGLLLFPALLPLLARLLALLPVPPLRVSRANCSKQEYRAGYGGDSKSLNITIFHYPSPLIPRTPIDSINEIAIRIPERSL